MFKKKAKFVAAALLCLTALGSGPCSNPQQQGDLCMYYKAKKIKGVVPIDGDINKKVWTEAEPALLTHYMGEKPDHFPTVTAKLAYDDAAIYVLFSVNDRFVKAVHTQYQSDVWKDSCVEFFFIPGKDRSQGYFNMEMNCGGTALFHFQRQQGVDDVAVEERDFKKITIFHSMPTAVFPEKQDSVQWVIEYKIPLNILGKYTKVTTPKAGEIWLMNLYKCADESSHPHWLTWAPVSFPKPKFHLPEFFGELRFE